MRYNKKKKKKKKDLFCGSARLLITVPGSLGHMGQFDASVR